MGPSGSGKSTMMNMLGCLDIPTSGEYLLDGKRVSELNDNQLADIRNQKVGFVFQRFMLLSNLTARGNVELPLRYAGVPAKERRQRAEKALQDVGLSDRMHHRSNELSGGQQQRVALARALVFEPELVLMDEPLGALDKQLREKMQFEITHLAHELGITTVYVTHDQTEALTMSDRVAVFDDGRIQQLAPPDKLYEEPENSFVAQFIGENNTLEGVVKEIKGDVALVRLDDGELIDCKPVNVSKPGERTRVSIRPERVEYNKERLQEGVHTLKAEVLEFIYMGDIFRTRLRVAGNDDFIIKTRNAPDQVRLQPGTQIEIGWLPEDCRALDA
jgi:putative spermidine/putrescine transport system ATP-binding protein